jgi:DNA modification methylase
MSTFQLDNPLAQVYIGDCRDVLKQLPAGRFDLVFADPPFNYEVKYGIWNDGLPWDEYERFTAAWIDLAIERLSERGSIVINVPDEIASFIDQHITKHWGLPRINWCIWHYRFGQCTDTRFIRSKVHVLHYAYNEACRIWRPERILEASDRASKYNDKRTQETETPGLRCPFDVWYGSHMGRIQGNNAERNPLHPNQLPEKYLERVILALTDPGSLVLDPFLGSGTSLTVAHALDRPAIGIEVNTLFAASAFERIKKGPVRLGKHVSE